MTLRPTSPMIDLLDSPLGPVFALVTAGVALRVLSRPKQGPWPALLPFLALAVTLVIVLRLPVGGAASVQLAWWPLVISPLQVRWVVNGWNWLALFLLTISAAGALLITWRRAGWRTAAFHGLSLLLVATAAITVVSDNLLTLSVAWVATDVMLIARSRAGRLGGGVAPVGLAATGSLLVFLSINITSLSMSSASLATADLPAETLALLLLAAAVRMALYPFHLWLGPSPAAGEPGTQWLVAGVALVTGGWLLGQLYTLGASFWLTDPAWSPVLAVCTLGAALAAWASRDEDRLTLLASSLASWSWLTLTMAPANLGREALGWAMLAAVLGLMLYVIGRAILQSWRWRVPLALTAAILAGLPLTVGLPARALAAPQNAPVWTLAVLAQGLILSCVLMPWRRASRPDSSRPSGNPLPVEVGTQPVGPEDNGAVPRLLIAFGLAALPAILWGIQPQALADLAGFMTAPSLGEFIASLSLAQWAATVVSLALGVILTRIVFQPGRSQTELDFWRPRVAAFTSLTWTLPALQLAILWLERSWRAMVSIFEGEGYLGWVALLILLAWLVIRA